MKQVVLTGILIGMLATVAAAQVQGTHRWQGLLISPGQLQVRKAILRYELLHRRMLREAGLTPLERRKLQKIRKHQRRKAFHSLRR